MSKKPILLFVAFALFVLYASAQGVNPGSVKGRLIDSTSKQVMKAATITIMEAKDSSIVTYAISDSTGRFNFDKLDANTYLFTITFQGYDDVVKRVTVANGTAGVDLGNVYMKPSANVLQEVIVQSTPPISLKKDTVEFNAGSFKTKPNAVAEDLLKKLPGVEVDKDGNIKAQGESVSRILVDGKRFFSDDPKLATKNLPPDVIDKIQVFDALSDQSAFTGFDDGNRVKTINIVTKKDKRKGYFGRAVAGVGDKDLYQASVNVNRFNGNQQMSLVGQGNNTNQQLFSVQDQLGSFSGGGGRGGSGGGGGGGSRGGGGGGGGNRGSSVSTTNGNNGLTTTWAGGLNYRDVWSKKTEVYGSYFYNNLQVVKDQKIATENFIKGDSSIYNNQDQNSKTTNQNHRFNFNIEQQFDSSNSMIFRTNVSYQNTDAGSNQQSVSTKGKTLAYGNSNSITTRENDGYSGSGQLTLRHKFKAPGRTLSLDMNFNGSTNDGDGTSYSVNTSFDKNGLNPTVKTVNQRYDSKSNNNSYSGTLSYTEPVGKGQLIELAYNATLSKNNSSRLTYNYDSTTHGYTMIDSGLTNNFENTNTQNRFTLSYRMQQAKFNFSVGSGVLFSTQESDNLSKSIFLKQNFVNLYPTANFNYQFTKSNQIRFFYTGRTSQPSVTQLQPVTDYSNPNSITQGNPDLKQEMTHSFRLLYNKYDQQTFRSMFASVNASFVANNIVNAVTYVQPGKPLPPGVPTGTPNGATVTKPINLNGTFNIVGYFNYSFPLKKPKSNLNFASNVSYSTTPGLVNDTLNTTRNTALGETIRWTTNLSSNFDMNFSSTSTYNIARYSIQPDQNANYFSQALNVEATAYTNNGWLIASDFDFTAYTGRADGYNTVVPLWNASVAKQFLKNKAAEIRFSVFDLLNQNVSITRNTTENYVQDVQTKVLTRYFLVTFTYNLRNFAGGQGQRMPGFFRGNGGGGRNGFGGGNGGGGFRKQ